MIPQRPSQFSPARVDHPSALNQLRWVGLAGILLVAGSAGRLDSPIAGLCALYALGLVWQGFSARSTPTRVWLGGSQESPLWWALLLPAAPVARWWGFLAGAGVTIGAWLVTTGIGLALAGPVGLAWQRLGLEGGGLLVGAIVIGWLSVQWPSTMRSSEVRSSETIQEMPDTLGEILQVASRLNETTALDQLGLRIIDLVNVVLSDRSTRPMIRPAGLWIGSATEGDWELTIGFAPGEKADEPSTPNAMAEALRSGEPRMVISPDKDPFVRLYPGMESAGAVVIVPLTLPGGAKLGAALVAVDEDDAPSGDVLNRLRAAGTNAALVWERASRYRELVSEKDQLTELQEEARKRLARNLHDGPTQTIASIAMRANFARRQITRDPDAAVEEIAKVEEMARQTTREIRHMLFTLRPLILESQGLGPALYQLALKARDSHDEDIQLGIDPGSTAGMEPGVQGALFYIVEEAVTNVQKHAAAEHIWIRLEREAEGLRLEVEDDGVGFNVGAVDAHYEQRGSLGMVNMRERAELAGGVLSVISTEGRGTCISVSLPAGEATGPDDHA